MNQYLGQQFLAVHMKRVYRNDLNKEIRQYNVKKCVLKKHPKIGIQIRN